MELFLDTTGKYLNVAIFDEGKLVENVHQESPRSQSEHIIPMINDLCRKHHYTANDIKGVIITKGPGSYTGVRIAMTVAKVLCSTKKIPLYTLSTLQAMSLGVEGKVCAMIDARSNRAFVGFYENGQKLEEESILTLDELNEKCKDTSYVFVGDSALIGKKAVDTDMNAEVFRNRLVWEKVENVHTLTPSYLKDSDSYGK